INPQPITHDIAGVVLFSTTIYDNALTISLDNGANIDKLVLKPSSGNNNLDVTIGNMPLPRTVPNKPAYSFDTDFELVYNVAQGGMPTPRRIPRIPAASIPRPILCGAAVYNNDLNA